MSETLSEKRVSHRQEWLRQWGFPAENAEYTKSMLIKLESQLNEHRCRVTRDMEPEGNNCIHKWNELPVVQKLFFVLEYHLRVAPYSWWERYFHALQENKEA